ncbi:glycosyltransferase family 32 protein [Xylona heveae TC161]|uniref:Glycosyltransferase family 32 protein n=1 Tax=Xylona heveae (strain CBS 132557 / TC161) TaxID=1328760 RepID=A0A161TPZ2_XYLHT|nr:glycosyltransferase family 32 protein [Xylona heveae TC161]KZF24346.1 glycosyltransferase family 32 protein [Xylona heveae TC161]
MFPKRFAIIALLTCFFFAIFVFQFQRDQGILPSTTRFLCPSAPQSTSKPNATVDLSEVPFPKKIWQSWKSPVSMLEGGDLDNVRSWKKLNPEYRYELLTDAAAETYVLDTFLATRPDIVEVFLSLHSVILRSDFLRYLLLLGDGGVYSDIDTKNLKPVRDWIPSWYAEDTNIVVGIEVDEPDGQKWSGWRYNYQFCQWTIMSKPGHPIIETVVDRVIKSLWDMADKQNTTLNRVKTFSEDVIATTGPGAFTDAVFEILTEQAGKNITAHDITRLKSPKLLGDVLILPVNAFAPGQSHSKAGKPEDDGSLVQHMWKSSWWGDNPQGNFEDHKKKKEEEEEQKKKEEEQKSQKDENNSGQGNANQKRQEDGLRRQEEER